LQLPFEEEEAFEKPVSCYSCVKETSMRTQTAFEKCAEPVIAQAREHWARKQARLDELIGIEDPDEAQVDLRVHCEPEANRYAVRAILPLPSATLTAEALDADVRKALDRVAELLAEAVQQHREGPPMESVIDEVEIASADSFPASDPPSWTHVTVSGPSNG
jgi:ribosome-associated translation inhibitor RaiA